MLPVAIIDSQKYFFDATSSLRPFDLLPLELLLCRGIVVKKDPYDWVTLASAKKASERSMVTVNIQGGGDISGTIQSVCSDYAALNFRTEQLKKKDNEMVRNVFNLDELIQIDSTKIFAKDSVDLPITINARFSSKAYTQNTEDKIYFNPHFIQKFTKSPFTEPTRKFPINFGHQREQTTVMYINFPEGYEVESCVADREIHPLKDIIGFSRRSAVEGNTIRITVKFGIKGLSFEPMYYEMITMLYADIIACMNDQIVLRKIRPKQPEPAAPEVKQQIQAEQPAASTVTPSAKKKSKK